MKICILENDYIDPEMAGRFKGYGAMFERLLRDAGASASFDVFNTELGQYPSSFDDYDAVILTGGRADAFSTKPWVVRLREKVTSLLKPESKPKVIGVCLGHQLVGLCMGAPVGRSQQGWGAGRMTYRWLDPDFGGEPQPSEIALLASHQDQVFELPQGATLLATSDFCPVAAFCVGEHVLCVQPHPEFVEDYSAYLLQKRRKSLGEDQFQQGMAELVKGHEGARFARMMLAFIEGRGSPKPAQA